MATASGQTIWKNPQKVAARQTPTATPVATPTATTYGSTGVTPMTNTASELSTLAGQNMLSAGNVIGQQVSGQSFNAFAAQQKAAQAAAERAQRSAAAQQIHQAGFSGSALGAGAGNSVESDILQNRFKNTLNTEVERQNKMLQGAEAAQGYANNVNRFNAETAAEGMGRISNAITGISGRFTIDTALSEAMSAAGGDTARQYAIMDDWVKNNPDALAEARAYYGRDNINTQDMLNLYNGVKNNSDPLYLGRQFIQQLFPDYSAEEVEAALQVLFGGAMGISASGGAAIDTAHKIVTGDVDIKTYQFEGANSAAKKKDPTYQALLNDERVPKFTEENDGSADVTIVGAREGTQMYNKTLGVGRGDDFGHTQNAAYEAALKNGTPVNVGGTLYYVEKKTEKSGSKGWNDSISQFYASHFLGVPGAMLQLGSKYTSGTTTYVLKDPLTGKTKEVTTEAKGGKF